MVETILLDCGGVMCRPATGNWLVPRNFHALMDDFLVGISLEDLRAARKKANEIMDSSHHLYTEELEYEQRYAFFDNCYRRFLHLPVPHETLHKLAESMVYDDDRFVFYEDTLPVLEKWQRKYRLGMVSDTHPQLRRVMRNNGTLQTLDAVSLSCENGVFKPHPHMYEMALQALNAKPETTIFVDDLEKNLYGAEKLGVRGVKIIRDVYTDEPILHEGTWKGTVVRSLAELDAILEDL